MPTWVSADRTAQRGCEPRAINPLQREKRERGRFLVGGDIGTKRDLFNKLHTRSAASSFRPVPPGFPVDWLILSQTAGSVLVLAVGFPARRPTISLFATPGKIGPTA